MFKTACVVLMTILSASMPLWSQLVENVDPTVSQFQIVHGSGDPNYNGDLNLSIPLLTVPGRGGLDYDITLNWVHGNGVPATESASWVGLGWNLDAFQITCSANYDPGYQEGSKSYVGLDAPDNYYLSYPGGSTAIVSFMDANGNDVWKPLNWKALKIEAIPDDAQGINDPNIHVAFKKFVITDLDGTRYVYSERLWSESEMQLKNLCKITQDVQNERVCDHWYGSSKVSHRYFYVYKLTAILAANYVDANADNEELNPAPEDKGNWIRFEYTSPMVFQAINLDDPNPPVFPVQTTVNFLEQVITPTYSAQFITTTTKPRAFIFRGRQVKSTSGSYLPSLEKIELRRNDGGDIIRTIHFETDNSWGWVYRGQNGHEYVEDGFDGSIGKWEKRLKLTAVSVEGKGGVTEPPYQFGYFGEDASEIPDIALSPTDEENWPNAKKQIDDGDFVTIDPWGGIQSYPDSYQEFSNNTLAKFWMLKKITYRTGGSVEFDFENDRYEVHCPNEAGCSSNIPSTNFMGGVRLVTQEIYDPLSEETSTYQYTYSSLNDTLGQRRGFLSGKLGTNGINLAGNGIGLNYRFDVHYPDVTIIAPDGSRVQRYYTCSFTGDGKGQTESQKYSPIFETIVPNETAYSDPFIDDFDINDYLHTSNDHIRQVFSNNGSNRFYLSTFDYPTSDDGYQALVNEAKEFDDYYSILDGRPLQVFDHQWKRGHLVREEYYAVGDTVNPIEATVYKYSQNPLHTEAYKAGYWTGSTIYSQAIFVTSGWMRLEEVEHFTQDEVGSQEMTEVKSDDLYYNSTNGLVIVKDEHVNNTTKKTTNKYAFEASGTYELGDIAADMTTRHMLSQLYSTTVYDGGDIESKSWTEWDETPAGYVAPSAEWAWRGQDGIDDTSAPNAPNDLNDQPNEAIRTALYVSYDNYGNLTQMRDGNNNLITGTWDSANDFAVLKTLTRDDLTTTYDYDPNTLLMTMRTDPNGLKTSFLHDGLGRLVQIHDHDNALLADYEYVYSNGNWDPPNLSLNYVSTRTYRATNDFTTSREYYDGIGRSVQTQQNLGAGSIKTATEYDDLGRVWRVTKPFDHSNQQYAVNAIAAAAQNYSDRSPYSPNPTTDVGQYPYSETLYYADPLNRVREQSAPGVDFSGSGHAVRFIYGTNTEDDDVGNFDEHTLQKQRQEDEDQRLVSTFTDGFGNNVATVVDSSGFTLQTLFEYDVLDNLIRSTPPAGATFATEYLYNGRSELVEKSTPDAGTTRYIYDKNGNLRLVLDANGQFIYYKYDFLNRKIEEGLYDNAAAFTQDNADVATFPLSESDTDAHARVVYQYDSADGYSQAGNPQNLKSRLAVVEYEVAQFDTPGYEFYSYDVRGNVKYCHRWVPISETEWLVAQTDYDYDLQNNVTHVRFEPQNSGETLAGEILHFWYEYDELGRLIAVYAGDSPDQPETPEATYSYFPTGQVKRMDLSGGIQGIDYLYNSRDWLTQINHPSLDPDNDPGDDGNFGINYYYRVTAVSDNGVAESDPSNTFVISFEGAGSGGSGAMRFGDFPKVLTPNLAPVPSNTRKSVGGRR